MRTKTIPDTDSLIARVVTALDSPLELRGVLRMLVDLAVEATGADHASVLLLENRRLHPAVSAGAVTNDRNDQSWKSFRTMGPVELTPSQWKYVSSGEPLALEDLQPTAIIPTDWVDTFGFRAIVIVPFKAGDEPCGVLALDWLEPRTFTAEEITFMERLAGHFGDAVGAARPFEIIHRRARLQQALAAGAAALASPLGPREIVASLAHAYSNLLEPQVCGIALVDEDHVQMTTVASTGATTLGPMPLTDIPPHLVTFLGETWAADKRPLEVANDAWLSRLFATPETSWYLVLPLISEGHTQGGALLGFDQGRRLDDEERAAASALAAIATAALERHALLDRLDRQLRRLDALYHASAALADGADANALVESLNKLLTTHGVTIDAVSFHDRRLRRHLGGVAPSRAEMAAVEEGCHRFPDGSLAIPMRLDARVVGLLRVRPPDLESEQRDFLEALAAELAQVSMRGSLRASVEQADRERALSSERERFAADLHDTAGQRFIALGLLARRLGEEVAADVNTRNRVLRFAEVADEGKAEIDHATRGLTFLPAAQRGLVRALEDLCACMADDSGLHITVDVTGRRLRLGQASERALYRVAHDALANAWRHAHARSIAVQLAFASDATTLRVTDDGIGLGQADDASGFRIGIASMQRAMSDVGGSIEVTDAELHGTVVVARTARPST